MFTLVPKQKSTRQGKPASAALRGRAHSGQGREMRSILHLQRTIGNQAVQRLLRADRGYGEEPKPPEPAPKSGTESPSSTPQAGCGCSNLRLGEDKYEGAQKKVKFLFDVEPGKDPHQCVLVQQVIGQKYLLPTATPAEKMYPMSIAILGEQKPFNFPDWQIDSNDKDPVVWSRPDSRWNYRSEGEHTFSATDSPSTVTPYPAAPAVSAVKFKTGLYCASQVPTTLTAASQLGAPLQEVEWEDSTCWEHGKEPTHPGFGKECVWSAAKPGE